VKELSCPASNTDEECSFNVVSGGEEEAGTRHAKKFRIFNNDHNNVFSQFSNRTFFKFSFFDVFVARCCRRLTTFSWIFSVLIHRDLIHGIQDSSCMTMIYHIDYINAFCHNVNDMLQIDSISSN
jgi:hypothetical protein